MQDMKVLEENVEQSLLREEEALLQDEDAKLGGASDDVATVQKTLRDMKAKYEVRCIAPIIATELLTIVLP